MVQEQKNQIIIFPENMNEIIADLFAKNGIKETKKDAIERFKSGKYPKAVFLAKLCRDYFENKITDDNFVDSFKKTIEISEDTAKKIFLEAKEKIIKKISAEVQETTAKNQPAPAQKSETTLPPEGLPKKSLSKTPPAPKEIKNLPKKPAVSQVLKSSKPDSYREPIE